MAEPASGKCVASPRIQHRTEFVVALFVAWSFAPSGVKVADQTLELSDGPAQWLVDTTVESPSLVRMLQGVECRAHTNGESTQWWKSIQRCVL
jgi:hypothetical protein